jgi:hypothetical protein
VIVTVPTGVLRAYARYDNLLIQPALGIPSLPMALKFATPVPFVGPGGPVLPPSSVAGPAEPVLVKAMSAYYTRHFARAYKTQYCYVGAPGVPDQYIPSYFYCIPAFARSVKLLRFPATASFTVILSDGVNAALDEIVVPSGSSPTIPIVGTETIIAVRSTTHALTDSVNMLALCYEIGI